MALQMALVAASPTSLILPFETYEVKAEGQGLHNSIINRMGDFVTPIASG